MAKAQRKNIFRVVAASIGLCLIVLGFGAFANHEPVLTLNGQKFQYETSRTPAQHQQGLSGRASLAHNKAMLFVFSSADPYCFWMKDMHFALDMIWLNAQKQVVYIKENAAPDSYPAQFCSDKPASYVIEVNAGTVQRTSLKLGSTVQF